MSLYGGIKFTKAEQAVEDARVASESATSAANAVASSSTTTSASAAKANRPRAEAFLDGPPSRSASPAPGPEKLKAVEKSSAVLSFAPRIPKTKPAAPKPAFRATTYSAAPVLISQSAVVPDKPASIASTADEVLYDDDGKALARAPAMTLAAKAAVHTGDPAKKRKKKKKRRAQLIPTFDPEEQYDPNRPNDLAEYQRYRRRVKEERRAKYMEERRRKLAGESSGSSYYTDSEEEVAPRRDAPKLFAPPKQYSPPRSMPPTASSSSDDPYARRAAMTAAPASGDDAYARRAALTRPAEASGDDAYARRAAMSAAPGPPPFAPPQNWTPPPPPSFAPAPPSHPPPPTWAPPPPPAFVSAPPPPSDVPPPPPPGAQPPPPAPAPTPGGFYPPPPSLRPFVPPPSNLVAGAPTVNAMPPFPPRAIPASTSMPPTEAPRVPVAPPAPTAEELKFAAELEERKQKLAAIAAKFASLPNAPAPAAVFEEIEGEAFANKMMRKWGHTEGNKLGNRGDGLVEALTVEHFAAQPKNAADMSKRQLAKQKAAAANMKERKWVQHASARGKIINAAEEERQREEKDKHGEASRIICLLGVVGDVDDIDDDLAQDIGDECSKHGIVERVVLHMVEPPPDDPAESLRIFVVFSGMAGAWRNVRELHGRFFGGRKIRAVYFDEAKFDANDRDGPI